MPRVFCSFRAGTPDLLVIISQAAANHSVSGVRVPWKMVPAVAETTRLQPLHLCLPSARRQLSSSQ